MVLLAKRQDRRAEVPEDSSLPSWLLFDVAFRGFSRVGYLDSLRREFPDVDHHREFGIVDFSRLSRHGIDLGSAVLDALDMNECGGFVYGRLPEYRRNELLVVAELENAVFGVYLRTGDASLLDRLDRTLERSGLAHTDRWPVYLARARQEFARRREVPQETEMTLTEPLPISLRDGEEGAKSPELRLVESLVHGYLSYLPERIKTELLETGCAFVRNMRLLLKQFPDLEHDQNVLKVNFFAGRNGKTSGNRLARRLLGIEPHNGWIVVRDARRQIEHNLSEALKVRFELATERRAHRAPSTAEKVLLSTLLNEHGIGCTFDRDNRRSRKFGWTTVLGGSQRRVLGSAALDALGVSDSEGDLGPE